MQSCTRLFCRRCHAMWDDNDVSRGLCDALVDLGMVNADMDAPNALEEARFGLSRRWVLAHADAAQCASDGRVDGKAKCWAFGCNEQGSRKCSSCSVARYCSVKCQKSAWRSHKEACKGCLQTTPLPAHVDKH
jgi:hypothetical protein